MWTDHPRTAATISHADAQFSLPPAIICPHLEAQKGWCHRIALGLPGDSAFWKSCRTDARTVAWS